MRYRVIRRLDAGETFLPGRVIDMDEDAARPLVDLGTIEPLPDDTASATDTAHSPNSDPAERGQNGAPAGDGGGDPSDPQPDADPVRSFLAGRRAEGAGKPTVREIRDATGQRIRAADRDRIWAELTTAS